MVLFKSSCKMLTPVELLPYKRAGLLSRQRQLVVDNRFGNRWIQGNNKEGAEVAATITTKDRLQLVRNLSMDSIHRLKNIIYHGKIFWKITRIQEFFSDKLTNRHFRRNHTKWEHIWMVLPKPFSVAAVVHLEYIEGWVPHIYRYRRL